MPPDAPQPENPPKPEEDINLSGYLNQHKPVDRGWKAVKYYHEDRTPWPVRWMMKLSGGLIKTEKQAAIAVLVFIVFSIAASIAILVFGNQRPAGTLPPGARIISEPGVPPRLEQPIPR